jgi:hypothetical protein
MSQQPKKKAAQTRPMTAPLPKKGTTSQLKGKGGKPGKKGKPRKKKASAGFGPMAQLIGGATLLVVVVGVAVLGSSVAEKLIPKEVPSPVVGGVKRPVIKATVVGVEPRRPGWALSPDDEVYDHKATDVVKTPLEPPVNGLLAKEVLTVFADGKFRPSMPVTRAEFVNWCYNAVMAQTIPSRDPLAPTKRSIRSRDAEQADFPDVTEEHWAAPVLASLQGAKLLDTKAFRPDAALTRAEWAAFASRFAATLNEQASLSTPIDAKKLAIAYRRHNYLDLAAVKAADKPFVNFVFTDSRRADWLDEAFTPPDTPGPWGPNKPLTRGEAAAWIGGVYDQIGKDIY